MLVPALDWWPSGLWALQGIPFTVNLFVTYSLLKSHNRFFALFELWLGSNSIFEKLACCDGQKRGALLTGTFIFTALFDGVCIFI